MDKNELAFDVSISTNKEPIINFHIEITENYEGDKWHVVVYETQKVGKVFEHYETLGFENMDKFINYLRQLTEE